MKKNESPVPFLFSGKFGNVVGRIVNGKQVIAQLPRKRRTKPTTRELEIRRNFAIAIRFLKPIAPFLREKYSEPHGRSGFNKACSEVLRHAIQGDHPNQRIHYPLVLFGRGTLPNPDKHLVESPAKGLLEITWSHEKMKRRISKSDRLFVVVYCEARHYFQFELAGSERHEKHFLMDVAHFSGHKVETWIGFASSDGLLVSTSIYAGSVTVL